MEERKGWMSPRNQLIACVIKQYGTDLYRVWVSLGEGHTACLGSHHEEADATETINRFMEIYLGGEMRVPEDILTYINSICAQDLAAPLPVVEQGVGEMVA
jgi:hypothetical protein